MLRLTRPPAVRSPLANLLFLDLSLLFNLAIFFFLRCWAVVVTTRLFSYWAPPRFGGQVNSSLDIDYACGSDC